MRTGIHHLHIRKRIHEQYQKYPHPDPKIRFLDNLIMVISVVAPFTTLPQLYDIWILHQAAGISIITWTLYAILNIPMLIYCIVHKVKPLIIMNILWLLINSLVAVGAMMYG